MGQITVEKNVGGIEGLCVITPAVHGDSRGYFFESYNENDMKENGLNISLDDAKVAFANSEPLSQEDLDKVAGGCCTDNICHGDCC